VILGTVSFASHSVKHQEIIITITTIM